MSHSCEPWTTAKMGEIDICYPFCARIWDADHREIGRIEDGIVAARIVACVNFCREFPTEVLEKHQLVKIKASYKQSGEDIPGYGIFVAILPLTESEAPK